MRFMDASSTLMPSSSNSSARAVSEVLVAVDVVAVGPFFNRDNNGVRRRLHGRLIKWAILVKERVVQVPPFSIDDRTVADEPKSGVHEADRIPAFIEHRGPAGLLPLRHDDHLERNNSLRMDLPLSHIPTPVFWPELAPEGGTSLNPP